MFPSVNFANYPNREKIRNEFIQLKQKYPNLDVKMDNCNLLPTSSDAQIINISLNLPINKMSLKVDVSMEIYMEYLYPLKPPIAIIKPITNKQFKLKPWNHIDASGKLKTPYLTKWNEFTSNLSDFLIELQALLEKEFPFEIKSSITVKADKKVGSNSQLRTMDIKEVREAAQNAVYGVNGIHTKSGNVTHHSTMVSSIRDPNINMINLLPYNSLTSKPVHSDIISTNKNLTITKPNMPVINDTVIDKYMESFKREKLQQEVQNKFYKVLGESVQLRNINIDYLRQENSELSNKHHNLSVLSNKLSEQINMITLENEREVSKKNEMNEILQKFERHSKEGIDADGVVIPIYRLYKQIFTLYQEDQSIDDAIFFLEHAFSRDVIDTELFLKKVRELSRKQFMVRATIENGINICSDSSS